MKGAGKPGNSSRKHPTMINVTKAKPTVPAPNTQSRNVTNDPNQNVTATNAATTTTARAIGLPPTPPSSTTYREQDHYVPITNLVRIMRRALPPHAKVSDGAKETVQECVSEFISFVTEEANEKCRQEQRKTVTADDLIWAMGRLGFDDYVGPLSLYLQKYRETEGAGRVKNMGTVQRRPKWQYGFQGAGPSTEPAAAGPMVGGGSGSGLMPGPAIMPALPMIPHPGLMDYSYYNDGSGSSSGSNTGFGYSFGAVGNESSTGPSPNMNYSFGAGIGNNEKPEGSSAASSTEEDDLDSFDPQIFFNNDK